MATKFYFRAVAQDNDPGTLELSENSPGGDVFVDFGQAPVSLEIAKGTSAVSLQGASSATLDEQSNFFTSFSSKALKAQTITAQTWTLAIMCAESANSANSFSMPVVYVFREPSTIVGFIYDVHASIGNEWKNTAEGRVATFSGSEVTVLAGDYLVCELWRHATQSMATAYTQTIRIDGTVEPTEGSTDADAASYISTPQDLTFEGGGLSIPLAFDHLAMGHNQ